MNNYFGKNTQENHGNGYTDEGLQVRVETNINTGKYRNVKHVFLFIYLFLGYIHICKYISSSCVFPYTPWIPIIYW
jgi:hypothetical protein